MPFASILSLLAALLLMASTTGLAQEHEVVVDPPVRITVQPADSERLRGWLNAYDDDGFTIKTVDEQTVRVAWDSLPPDRVMWVQEKVLDRDDARGWFTLGSMLYNR
ncbi:MAG: hypothetical protein AAF663_12825, partial [Planctomycetota bacterium]